MIIEIEYLLNNKTNFILLKGTELPKTHRRYKISTDIPKFYIRCAQLV